MIGVIIAAILMTLFVKKFALDKDEFGLSALDRLLGIESPEPIRQDYSIQQAYLICQQEIRTRMGRDAKSIRYDSRSSRFDQSKNRFTVFFNVDISNGKGGIIESWAYCHISASSGAIEEYRLKGEKGFFKLF